MRNTSLDRIAARRDRSVLSRWRNMNFRMIATVSVAIAVHAANAALIPHYAMDSFALLADVIVLCEERSVQFKDIQHEKWTEQRTVVRCKPVRTFKGEMKAEAEFLLEYDSIFNRRLIGKGGYSVVDAEGNVTRVVQPEHLPPGRALLFLKKLNDSDSYSVVTAKLIQGDSVLQFGQFESNPGGLVLAPQKPENIKLVVTQKYRETELVEDLLIALKKAASLQKPVPISAWDALK
jgi:hypothetical protein